MKVYGSSDANSISTSNLSGRFRVNCCCGGADPGGSSSDEGELLREDEDGRAGQ